MSRIIAAIVFVGLTATAWSQGYYGAPPPQRTPSHAVQDRLQAGLYADIEIDAFSLRWGVRTERLLDAAELGVRRAGWEFRPTSDISIPVRIDSSRQISDSVCFLRVTVNTSEQFIKVVKGEEGLVASSVNRLVFRLADQMKRDLVRRDMSTPDPEGRMKSDDVW